MAFPSYKRQREMQYLGYWYHFSSDLQLRWETESSFQFDFCKALIMMLSTLITWLHLSNPMPGDGCSRNEEKRNECAHIGNFTRRGVEQPPWFQYQY